MTMKISDKEAYRLLGLPLGVDKEAIMKKYKKLSITLSTSKRPEDKKKLEMVIAAYNRLLPQPPPHNHNQNHKGQSGPSNGVDSEGSSEDDGRVLCRNGDARSLPKDGEMTEEDRERRKAEKKKEKKRRQKEKKKLEKIETQVLSQKIANNNHNKKKEESPSEEDEEEEEEEEEWEEGQGIDPNSAFVAAAAAKKRGVLGGGAQGRERPPRTTPHQPPTPPRIATNSTYVNNSASANASSVSSVPVYANVTRVEEAVEVIARDVVVTKAAREQACQLARRGNDAASVGSYIAAVQLFTDAIGLDPNDPRFLGNRSYCLNQLGHHEKALEDADRAVFLAPQCVKWHFRRGTPLKDLGRYMEAEEAFKEVLRHDPDCREAQEEVMRVRAARIAEMGFTDRQAISAISKYSDVQPALDALLAGEFKEAIDLTYHSGNTESLPRKPQATASRDNIKMNPQNPEGLMSLWVGNIVPDVTEKALTQLFASQGQVTSVRILREKHCAFVNFANRGDAGRGMAGLQGYQFHGQKLLIKFPDNPITSGFHRGGGSGGSNQNLNQSVVRRGNGLDGGAVGVGGGVSLLSSSVSSTGSSPVSSSSSSPGPPLTVSSALKKNTFDGELGNGTGDDIGTPPAPAYYHSNHTTTTTTDDNQVPSTPQPNQPNGEVAIAKNGVGLRFHTTQGIPQPLMPPTPLGPPPPLGHPKLKGPVNGGECYFWRTTGCKFADSCRYLHLPENHGVDRKPWQK